MTTAQHAAGPSPHNPQPFSDATRAAIACGPLTKALLDRRLEEACRRQVHPHEVFTPAEADHLWAIGQTLPEAIPEDVFDAIQAVG